MILPKKTFKSIDVFRLALKISPVIVVLYIAISFISALMPTVAMALATANFVDTAMSILRSESNHNDIYLPLVLLLLVLGISTTIGSVIQLVSLRINTNLQRNLRPAFVEIIAMLDFKHIENTDSWELISRVSRDPIASLMDGLRSFLTFMQIVASVASVMILIVARVWWAGIFILAYLVPMYFISKRAGNRNYQAGRNAEMFNRRVDYLGEVLTGRDAVDERTLFGYGEPINKRWCEQYEASRKLRFKVKIREFFIMKCSSITLVFFSLLVASTLIYPVINGQMTAGLFMGIISAVITLMRQLGWDLPWTIEGISRIGEYMKDLTAFITLSETIGAKSKPDQFPIPLVSLEFRNVRFKYPSGNTYVLDGLSFSLQPERHYAFVGINGAGKTTITKLLTGLYSEYEGEILINGKELRQYTAGSIKSLFSVIYQDFAKYHIRMKDNISLGDISGTDIDARIADLTDQAELGEIISALKDGIDTPLGKIIESGQDISGGQWQRIAIARSLLSRAPVKILDEPTAALDPIDESQIYQKFDGLMQGKTTIFISHRLGSTKLADEILVINDGQIVERGSHDDLMLKNGYYAEMFEAQRGMYE